MDSAVVARVRASTIRLSPIGTCLTSSSGAIGRWRRAAERRHRSAVHPLGKFFYSDALLALLPIHGAPGASALELQRNPALALHRGEINYQAQRAITHEEIRRAVKQLRERKDRERREKEEKTVAKKPIAPSGSR